MDVAAGDVTRADFAFSFNAVTNAKGGDNGDDDASAARTIQGSLRQFLQNANAINVCAVRIPLADADEGLDSKRPTR